MPLRLLFDNLIIPISIIEKKYKGGLYQCYLDHQDRNPWFDEHLFTICDMSFESLFYAAIDRLNTKGLNCYVLDENGIAMWKDAYITDRGFGRKYTHPKWISFASHCDKVLTGKDNKSGEDTYIPDFYTSVYLTGTNPGRKIIDETYGESISSQYVISDEKPGDFMLKFKEKYNI